MSQNLLSLVSSNNSSLSSAVSTIFSLLVSLKNFNLLTPFSNLFRLPFLHFNFSSAMTGKKIQTSPSGSPSSSSTRDQESFLPIANVSRIMKRSLPANAKVSKEAKETVQECVSEFISFITGEASDKCQREKRKTINGDDLLWAMTTLGFENYVGPLKVYLNKYREIEGEKNSMAVQEDKSFPNTIAMNEVNLDGPSYMSNRQDFQSFNEFYELEAAKSYGEDLVSGGFDTRNKIHELGDGSAKRVPTTHLPLEYW